MVATRNLIQHPELIAKVQKALGIRQGSLIPTLNEGVQVVVVAHDLTAADRSTQLGFTGIDSGHIAGAIQALTATQDGQVNFCNKSTVTSLGGGATAKIFRMRRLEVRLDAALGAGVSTEIRMGWSANQSLGGAGGFAARSKVRGILTTSMIPDPDLQVFQSAAVAPTTFTAQIALQIHMSSAQPYVLYEPTGIVIEPGAVWVVQTFNNTGANGQAMNLSVNAFFDIEGGLQGGQAVG